LKEKDQCCEKLEIENTSLRKELEGTIIQLNTKLKFEKSIAILDNILIYQRSPSIKTGLGYDYNQNTLEKDASSMSSKNKIEEKSESYADVLKISNHSEEEENHIHVGVDCTPSTK
jgi:hypothetical protein